MPSPSDNFPEQDTPQEHDTEQRSLVKMVELTQTVVGERGGVEITGTAPTVGPFRAIRALGATVINSATATTEWGGGTILASYAFGDKDVIIAGIASITLTSGKILAYY